MKFIHAPFVKLEFDFVPRLIFSNQKLKRTKKRFILLLKTFEKQGLHILTLNSSYADLWFGPLRATFDALSVPISFF